MARVDFYVLAAADERARHMLACKLAEKAWRLENTVYIHAKDRADAERLDELLWTFRDGSFVPHGLAGRNDGTEVSPIMIGYNDQGPGA
ncbi:MAG: DNA polymerase III subunit chi, partial [Gammaproteobacteria bacterium]|nr:DNA polymerase III subunit chi [Gammaproteobacteria bacterium]